MPSKTPSRLGLQSGLGSDFRQAFVEENEASVTLCFIFNNRQYCIHQKVNLMTISSISAAAKPASSRLARHRKKKNLEEIILQICMRKS